MTKRKFVLWLLPFICFLLPLIGVGQNLVPNGDFEYKSGRRHTQKPWRFVNTVDFFVIDGTKKLPPDTEKWNLPKPKDGVAYVGLRIYSDYREFIQVKLNEKLVEGNKYYFEMWISWSDHSNYYGKEFGASIYYKKPSYTSDYFIFTKPPQINVENQRGIIQSDSSSWMRISGYYRAKGGEKYLSIGNFSTTHFKDRLKKKNWWSLRFWHHEAYYFVDAVSLVKIEEYDEENDTILAKKIDESTLIVENENYVYDIEKDSTLIIENLQFASGSDKILQSSYRELELILEYINENPDKNLQIIGYTDDVGSSSSNQKLSENRAKSVHKYFMHNKIDKNRISYIGKGESDPIESNETSAGKKANRRVELKLIETKAK